MLAHEQASSPAIDATTTGRVAGLDALRGLMLTIVLADHCGGLLTEARFIRQWTLMGLGWSDAAEVFVFLSGITFGWVYSARIQRQGSWPALLQGIRRSLQLYSAYLLTVMGVALLQALQRGDSWQAIAADLDSRIVSALLLREQPYAMGILCLYVVCLPITLLTFVVLGRDKWWLTLLFSYACYSVVQVFPAFNLRTEHGVWYFNPFAWQLLMVCGSVLGRELRLGGTGPLPTTPRARTLVAALAGALVLTSLWFQKGELLTGSPWMDWFQNSIGYPNWHYEWLSKSTIGPLRLLHFVAMAALLSLIAPLRSPYWSHWSLAPLRACGRHSLELYCSGVLLTHALTFAPAAFSATPLRATLLVAVVLASQCMAAVLLDLGSRKAKCLER